MNNSFYSLKNKKKIGVFFDKNIKLKVNYSPNFMIKYKKNTDKKNYLLIIVSKKNFPLASTRNKIKRQIRNILNKIDMKTCDTTYCLFISKTYKIDEYKLIESELTNQITKLS